MIYNNVDNKMVSSMAYLQAVEGLTVF